MTILFRGFALIALLTTTALVTPSFAQTTDQPGGASTSAGMQSGGKGGAQAPAAQGGGSVGDQSGEQGGAGAAVCDQTSNSPDCPPAAGGMKSQRNELGGNKPGSMKSEQMKPNAQGLDQVSPGNNSKSSGTNSRSSGATTSSETRSGTTSPQKETSTKGKAGGTQSGGETTNNTNGSNARSTTNKSNSSNGASSSSSSVNVNITTQQRTEIRQEIKSINVAPVAHVDFDVSVGIAVPRTVHLRPLPARVVRLVPAYEHFLFFLLPDGRIVIVDPHSLQIVFILD